MCVLHHSCLQCWIFCTVHLWRGQATGDQLDSNPHYLSLQSYLDCCFTFNFNLTCGLVLPLEGCRLDRSCGEHRQTFLLEQNVFFFIALLGSAGGVNNAFLIVSQRPTMCCYQHMLLHVATHWEEMRKQPLSPASRGLWKIHSAAQRTGATAWILDYRFHSFFHYFTLLLFPQGGSCLFSPPLIPN